MSQYFNPTGAGIRSDLVGDGAFGAPRGRRMHRGLDLVATPGQPVFSPGAGMVGRLAYPYGTDLYWTGIFIEGRLHDFKMFYLSPDQSLISHWVERGQQLGVAQDISMKYEGSTPHVHLEIIAKPNTVMYGDGTWNQREIWVDPAPLIGIYT